jgi:hypothetical protein
MANENTNQADNTERDQRIKEEYDELIRRGTHDTATASSALSVQYRISAEKILDMVGRSVKQQRPEQRAEDRDTHATQERQVRQNY